MSDSLPVTGVHPVGMPFRRWLLLGSIVVLAAGLVVPAYVEVVPRFWPAVVARWYPAVFLRPLVTAILDERLGDQDRQILTAKLSSRGHAVILPLLAQMPAGSYPRDNYAYRVIIAILCDEVWIARREPVWQEVPSGLAMAMVAEIARIEARYAADRYPKGNPCAHLFILEGLRCQDPAALLRAMVSACERYRVLPQSVRLFVDQIAQRAARDLPGAQACLADLGRHGDPVIRAAAEARLQAPAP
jgi:hypothetical protein